MADIVGVASEEGRSITGPLGAAWLPFALGIVDKRACAQDKEAQLGCVRWALVWGKRGVIIIWIQHGLC